MSVHRRKYSKEFKMEMVEAVLSGKSPLALGKENDIRPNLITRWKKQYLEGRFHGNSENDTQLRKVNYPRLKSGASYYYFPNSSFSCPVSSLY